MRDFDTIILKAPAGTKARWVHLANGEKLSSFVVRLIDEPPNPEKWLARFAKKEPGSMAFITESELREFGRKAYLAGAYKL